MCKRVDSAFKFARPVVLEEGWKLHLSTIVVSFDVTKDLRNAWVCPIVSVARVGRLTLGSTLAEFSTYF